MLDRLLHRSVVLNQQRNAKLIFEVALRLDAGSSGIYSWPEARRRALRRPPVDPNVSSHDDRIV